MDNATRAPDKYPQSTSELQLPLILGMAADAGSPSTVPQPPLLANEISTVRPNERKNMTDAVTDSLVLKQEPRKHIGENKTGARKITKKVDLTRDHRRKIQQTHKIVGAKHMRASQLSFGSPWLFGEAIKKEHDSNWSGAYEEVLDK